MGAKLPLIPRHSTDWIAALDPGKRCPGVALFCDGRVVDATALPNTGDVDAAAVAVLQWLNGRCDYLVVERPQVYPGRRAADYGITCLKDMIAIVSAFKRPYIELYPSDWKGSVPKGVTTERLRRRLVPARCTPALWADVTTRAGVALDAFDAIGIGAYALGWVRRGCI